MRGKERRGGEEKKEMSELVTHFRQKHDTYESSESENFQCSACGIIGFGERHRCRICNLILHRCCQNRWRRVTCKMHPPAANLDHLHHYMDFMVVDSPQTLFECHACGGPIVGGYYKCERLSADPIKVHPTCRLFQKSHSNSSITTSSSKETIQLYYHPGTQDHLLQEVFVVGRYICFICFQVGYGLSMACPPCGVNFHPYCVKKNAICEEKNCFLHPTNHSMKWISGVRREGEGLALQCRICCGRIEGSYYLCEGANSIVHPICAKVLELDNGYHLGREILSHMFGCLFTAVIMWLTGKNYRREEKDD